MSKSKKTCHSELVSESINKWYFIFEMKKDVVGNNRIKLDPETSSG
jgi:hypothetical protein